MKLNSVVVQEPMGISVVTLTTVTLNQGMNSGRLKISYDKCGFFIKIEIH
jgi:hypothetical protein